MKRLNWSEDKINGLDRIFLRRVLDQMRGFQGTTVRFGETGVVGEKPNYQVAYPNGVTRTIRGSNHENFDEADKFNDDNLSSPFSLETIQHAYNQA